MDLYDHSGREYLAPNSPSTPNTLQSLTYSGPSLLSTPGATPPVYSSGSKMKRFGQRLTFWKRRKITAADVQVELEKLAKAHEKYQVRFRLTIECLHYWTEYLNPPGHVEKDALQGQLNDEWLSKWFSSMIDIIKPVLELQSQEGLLISSFAHSFQALKDEESSCRDTIHKLSNADKRYYKSMASNRTPLETNEHDRERQLLFNQLSDAIMRFRLVARRELPVRFQQLVNHMQNICSTLRPAETAVSSLLPREDDIDLGRPPERFASFYERNSPDSACSNEEIKPLHIGSYQSGYQFEKLGRDNYEDNNHNDTNIHISASKNDNKNKDQTITDAVNYESKRGNGDDANPNSEELYLAGGESEDFAWR